MRIRKKSHTHQWLYAGTISVLNDGELDWATCLLMFYGHNGILLGVVLDITREYLTNNEKLRCIKDKMA